MLRTPITLCLISFLGLPLLAQDAPKLETDDEKGSYAFGINVGNNLGPFADALEYDAFLAGLKDALDGKEPALAEEEAMGAFQAFQRKAMETMRTKNREAGATFLKTNAENKDVVQLPSGLQYKIVKKGEGDSPKATDTVSVHYTGTLADGQKFDSSRDRGEPTSFPVNGVIPGWTEALQLMKPGSQWMVYIPYDLAYGERGRPPSIPPFSTLIFDVELLEVK